MAKKRLKIGVLFGGKSAEHEVSVMSAKNVVSALDKDKYLVTKLKIGKDGAFNFAALKKFDVIFPVLHGPFGEDGSMQGVFKVMGKPFVGAGVLGSAVGMDKDVMKRLLVEGGVPIGKFLVFKKEDKRPDFSVVKKKLGLPMFVKPANMGSSVGVSKVNNKKELTEAVAEAFKYDNKIIVEEFIDAREIECAVLGNDKVVASVLGEVLATQEFYSYDAKYSDASSVTEIPAQIGKKETQKIRNLAAKTFKVLNCEGMGRVDFFLTKKGKIYVNEINTLPGFTDISMYPKLWEASGVSQTQLLDILIGLAIKRFQAEKRLKTTV